MKERLSYAKVGVDMSVTDAAKRDMAKSVDSGDPRVLNRMGAFASLLEGRFDALKHPILVFKTEEPGSKQKLAFARGRFEAIACDLVNHLVNDVIVMGAEPLYVQDCIVCGTIAPATVTALVSHIAAACKEQGCVLVGGETSVQPGVVADGEYVLSASAIGVVDKERIIDGSTIREGDIVLGVASNGLHTNGYTLVRRLLEQNRDLQGMEVNGASFMDAIMLPHTCYYKAIRGLFGHTGLKGLAHITGGGIEGNLNRILPGKLDALIDLPSLHVLEVFRIIRDEGNVRDAEMLRTFNMGVGLAIVSSQGAVGEIVSHLAGHNCAAYPIGTIVPGTGRVRYRGRLKWQDSSR
jgi:phosphoribosylformylglycinamidine cyclo-ligase